MRVTASRTGRARLHGLYAITDAILCRATGLEAAVAAALAGGARLVQYRDKGEDADRRLREARALLRLCRARGVPLIVNDDPELARRAGADGVHLGRGDPDPGRARALLGPAAIIGVSCYDDLDRAREAAAAGVDYLAFGRFFPSATKPDAVPASLDLLRQARRELDLPLVAIGGITPENGALPIAAGADMLAAVEAVFGQPDPGAAAQRFARLFSH